MTLQAWQELSKPPIRAWFEAFLREVGTGLDNALYEEALTHLLGGEERVVQEIEVTSENVSLGAQKFRLAAPQVALKVTALSNPTPFEIHARRLLKHTGLEAIQWINLTRNEVSFRTIQAGV